MQAFTHKTRIQVYGETKLLAHAHSNHGVFAYMPGKTHYWFVCIP